MKNVIRVLLVDDHALFRRGLQLVISEEDDIEVIGEAADGSEALELTKELEPDVVIMDVRMPRMSGIEAAEAIRQLDLHTRILILTVSEDEDDLFAAVRAGVSGYLLKEVATQEIPGAIRAVFAGQSLITPSMATKLLVEFNRLTDRARHGRPKGATLSVREVEVLRLLADGLPNREIAGRLHISENTVKNHVRNILDKLGMHSRMEAVIYAMQNGLLE